MIITRLRDRKERAFVLYQIFLVFVLPVLLLVFRIVPISWRMIVLCCAMLLMYNIIRQEQWPDAVFGISKKTFIRSLLPYALFTIIGVFTIIFISERLGIEPEVSWWSIPHLRFLFLPVSLLQEIAYRGFLFPKLRQATNNWTLIIVTNTLLFTLIHVIYPMKDVMIPFAAIAGVSFAIMYRYFPNLILISISHSVLNFVAILYGFFFIPR
ncbi:MAG TPA: CPBP family intramembrane glutamic endopeptidase [Candidatus Paceibacterota bacterium]|jgi:membrane protease YdiL (CAAX protease family)|nr:CPBP family intramembrane glutamic endopeptidase [Candidatus Paceibacterota bacterium]